MNSKNQICEKCKGTGYLSPTEDCPCKKFEPKNQKNTFDLSEKAEYGYGERRYKHSDIKEFIKRLKEELCPYITSKRNCPYCPTCKKIDNLAGEKLR